MKKISACRLLGCMTVGAMSLASVAHAQDATASAGTTGGMAGDTTAMTSSSTMSMTPTQVTGTVLRYYVDRSGYVTAMDVQTANGVQMVRFSPGMGQRLYSTYPVGGQASVYVMGNQMGGTTRMDVVGMGDTMPAAGMMSPYMVSDVDLLKADPFITIGAKMIQFRGTLKNLITDDSGEVLAMVLGSVLPPIGGMQGGMMAASDTSMGSGAGMSGGMAGGDSMSGGSMMGGDVLVRIPREFRHNTTMGRASMRVTPLFKGAIVEVVGYPEAPRYGVLSRYAQRVAANALVVDGRAVGALGIPMMSKTMGTLFNADIGGTSAEEKSAMTMGYSTYDPNMTMGASSSGGSMDSNATSSGTGSGTSGTGGSGGM